MGMYDSLHDGTHCAQVKCLGKQLGDFIPGDAAVLHRVDAHEDLKGLAEPADPALDASQEEFDAWAQHPYTVATLQGVRRPEQSWQVLLSGGMFATFVDHTFVGFTGDRDTGLRLVDTQGQDTDESGRFGMVGQSDGCEVCAGLVG